MFALNVSPGSDIRCVRIDHRLDLRGFSLSLQPKLRTVAWRSAGCLPQLVCTISDSFFRISFHVGFSFGRKTSRKAECSRHMKKGAAYTTTDD
jgi:hypothetical protein